ncbi:hypothetical protein DM02DRAFT_636529 [Periconia macrospinosa]|uniref:Uncharacterized protein n=1 Tax=Periconia macrospinosa TaxID=97972 RepID=A0A2V1D0P5_9PLEO|nr:hypothetical protein DM02DRAFT_636529 [Periconia macrospinosa]
MPRHSSRIARVSATPYTPTPSATFIAVDPSKRRPARRRRLSQKAQEAAQSASLRVETEVELGEQVELEQVADEVADVAMAQDEAPRQSSPLFVPEDNDDSETNDDVDEDVAEELVEEVVEEVEEDEDDEDDVIKVPAPAPKRPVVRRPPSTTDEGPEDPSKEDVVIQYRAFVNSVKNPIVNAARNNRWRKRHSSFQRSQVYHHV